MNKSFGANVAASMAVAASWLAPAGAVPIASLLALQNAMPLAYASGYDQDYVRFSVHRRPRHRILCAALPVLRRGLGHLRRLRWLAPLLPVKIKSKC
jgi:hypothetical protein